MISGCDLMVTTNMIKIDSEILKNIKEIAEKDNITETKLINQMLKIALELKRKKENKIPEHLIMNPNRKPDPKLTEELIGSIEVKEDFDTKKAIAEARGIK